MGYKTSAGRAEHLIRCLPMLRGYVRRLVGDGDIASDVLQNVSLTILSARGSPEDIAGFSAWSRGVARNVAAYELRARRRASQILPIGDDLAQALDPEPDPENSTAARTDLEQLAEHLDAGAIELLYRRYVLGESAKDLALELAQSPAALRMRLMRLRSHLRASTPPSRSRQLD